MKYSYFFLILVLFGCKSKKFCLEDNSELTLKEGFYREIPSGVYEGESTIDVTIIFNDFDKQLFEIKGFYFRNKFVEKNLKFNNFTLKGSLKLDKVDEHIPFTIENNEIVISYLKKEKTKYVKFSLKEQRNSIDNIPMEKN